MNLLLDTHVWVWSQVEPDRIGPKARRVLENTDTGLFVATLSSLEIARLVDAGSLELDGKLESWIKDSLEALQCGSLEMSHAAAMGAYQLPGAFHKDPADRILVATAREHGLTLVTADERILKYRSVKTLDARK
ncbi:MAG: type II toxin-antitoxin system VapC family toxin [Verrucomicrobia bacterium]|jgi:PIN domain nuclease of toxin-antitoxin system|nr:type II toxin-antitoxin system VapC family toxin [Verrucomicrobiota bacterium]MDA1065260.1 type II toxin-antitoxin system VapC family toxin [Verrucomicrobiota bacterium]